MRHGCSLLSCFADYRLYKLGAELQENQLGYSAVLAVLHAPSSVDMPSRPSTSTTEYYYQTSDAIPTEAWSIGDEPVNGRVHVVLDVTGAYFGHVMVTDPNTGNLVRKKYDAYISFHNGGTHPIEDPSNRRRELFL